MKRYIFVGFFMVMIYLLLVNSVLAGLSDGLVAYYPFAGNAEDVSDNGLHGTLMEGSYTANRFDIENAALSGYVEVPDNNLLDLMDGFTISAWLKLDAVEHAFNCWVGKGYTTAFGCGIDSGGSGACPAGDEVRRLMVLYIGNQSGYFGLEPSFSCGTDTWYHVAVTFDNTSGNAQLYVDGVIINTVVHKGTFTTIDAPLGIGRDGLHRDKFTGSIDEVRIYDRVLTSAEIEELFNLIEPDDTDSPEDPDDPEDSGSGKGSSGGCFVSTIK